MFEKLAETIQRLGYCSGLGKGYLFLGGTMMRPDEPEEGEPSNEEGEDA